MRFQGKIIWKVMPWLLVAILLCTGAVAWWAGRAVEGFHVEHWQGHLDAAAEAMAERMEPELLDASRQRINDRVNLYAAAADARMTLIRADGLVLGDSARDPATMDNHALRPEVREALAGEPGRSLRYSRTIEQESLYSARPVRDASGEVVAVVRASVATVHIDRALATVRFRIIVGGLVLAVLAMVLTFLVLYTQISRPLDQLRRGAARFAAGGLDQPVSVPDTAEIGELARTMNQMADQLNTRMREILRQAHERQTVLASMIEGVIAIDEAERVITINDAAARLLGIDTAEADGRSIYELVRNADLQRFLAATAKADQPVVGDVTIRTGGRQRFLKANGSVLIDDDGIRAGAVVVLHDVTRLRDLEIMRQQFVANVSHELKTPITAIKAAVETLIEDEQADEASPASRFLRIVVRQADRLNAIVEDLLMLARIEQESEQDVVQLEPGRVETVLRGAVETCQLNLESNEMALTLTVHPENLMARINAPLLEQALVNLLDNAIKYCPPGESITVSARREGGEVVIEVADSGPGIEAAHLPRIFERFYRTDKARSRSLGGTGLGLAIVKHIALAHGGRVSVDSIIDEGSCFRIHLPDDG